MFSTKSLIIKTIQSLAIVCTAWLLGSVPITVSALEDTATPGVIAIERVVASTGAIPSQGTYGVGPVHYKVQFSESVQSVTQDSFYVLVRSGCVITCASVSSVDTYPVAGQTSSDTYVVALDNFVDSGTVSIKPKPNSGIIDLVGNALDATSADLLFNVQNPLVDYVIDIEPILFDGFYIDGSEVHIVFNKPIRAGATVPLPDVGQFQFVDILTSQTIDAVSVVVNDSELIVDFGSAVSSGQSQFVYFANVLLAELMSEAGIRTESFSVEVQADGITYVYCSPRGGQPGSVCKSLTPPDVPMIASVQFLNAAGTYGVGDEINIQLDLTEEVHLSADFATELSLDVGPLNGAGIAYFDEAKTLDTAESVQSRVTSKIVLSYVIRTGDINPDFDRAPGNLVITSGNAEDTDDVVVNSLDVTTMPAPRSEGSLSDTSDIIIDGVGGFPVVSPASVSITPGSGIYGVGSVFTIYVTFDGAVSVSGTPYIQLNTGESARAYYDESQSTGNTLAFVYTVMLGDGGASLNYAFNTALQLDGGSIVVAGDPRNISADLSLPAVGSAQSLAGLVSISIVTNSEVPMVDVVSISPANGSYQNTSEFVLAGVDTALQEGDAVRVYHSGSTDVLCEGTVDALGIWSCAVTGLSDGVHSLELIARNSLGNESAPVAYVVTIDTVVPAELLIVDVIPQSQSLSNSSYPVFSGSLVSEAGSSVRVYESGQLVCEAQVLDTGEWACATLNQQTDGEHVFSIRVIDRAGNQSVPVELVLHIDATNPRVVSVSTPLSAGTYDVGDIIPIDVRFSEVVSVLGSVRLKIGPGEQYAEFSSLDEAATLDVIRLNYVVKEGDVISRLEYGGAGAFELLSGTIRDAAQNNAELTLPIPGAPGSLSADGSPVIVVSAPSTPIRRNSIVPLPGVSVYTNPKVPISGAAGSATPGSLIDIYYGRIKLCRSTVKPDGSWSCTIPVLLPGKHTFVLKLKLPGSSTWSSMDLVVTAKSSVQIKRCPAFRPARVIGYRGSDVIVLRLFLNTYTDAGLPLSDVYDQQLHDYIGSLVRARYHVPVLHCFTWWRI